MQYSAREESFPVHQREMAVRQFCQFTVILVKVWQDKHSLVTQLLSENF